jgi:hypothetical protein
MTRLGVAGRWPSRRRRGGRTRGDRRVDGHGVELAFDDAEAAEAVSADPVVPGDQHAEVRLGQARGTDRQPLAFCRSSRKPISPGSRAAPAVMSGR